MSLLEVSGLTKRFGGLLAVDALDLDVEAGTIVGLIGPNGAGKTTTFNCLTGLERPDAGRVLLDGHDIEGWSVHERARRGLGRTFQRLEVFSRMTTRENLRVAAELTRRHRSVWRELVRVRLPRDAEAEREVEEHLEWVGLADVADVVAGDLPTGRLRLLIQDPARC